jgi:photosystem II stability/assembly factor-like uncharacterized protein
MKIRILILALSLIFVIQSLLAADFWSKTSGIEGGTIISLARLKNNYYFAGTAYSGLYKSSDGGKNWSHVGKTLPNIAIGYIAITKDSDIIAGQLGSNGLYISTDTGESWQNISSTLNVHAYNAMITDDNDNIFIGSSRGVFISKDKGKSFTLDNAGFNDTMLSTNKDSIIVSMINSPMGYVIAGSINGNIFKFNNSSQSWEKINDLPIGGNVKSLMVNNGIFYAASDSSIGLYMSLDSGKTWTHDTISIKEHISSLISLPNGYAKAITNNGHVYRKELYWEIGLDTNIFVYSVTSNDASLPVIYGTRIDGIYIYNSYLLDTIGLYKSNSGLTAFRINNIVSTNEGSLFASSNDCALFQSVNNGVSWDRLMSFPSDSVLYTLISKPNGTLFAGTSAGIRKSTDYGKTWTQINNGLTNLLISAILIKPNGIMYAGTATRVEAGISGDIYRSIDGGAHWEEKNNGIIYLPGLYVKSLVVDSNNWVYLGSFGLSIYRTKDDGEHWERIGDQPPSYITTLFIDKKNNLFVSGEDAYGVWYSDNCGDNWTHLKQGMDSDSILCFTNYGDGILAGSLYNGVYYLESPTKAWIKMNPGLEDLDIWSLYSNFYLYYFAGSNSGGIYKYTLTDGIENSILPKHSLELAPNPVSDNLRLAFSNDNSENIIIKITDLFGRIVYYKQLIAEIGKTENTIDCTGWSNGVYLINLNKGSMVLSRIFIKE